MSTLVDNLEELVFEAHKAKGWSWVQSEPLWCTWTLEKFGMYYLCLVFQHSTIAYGEIGLATELARLLPPYHRSLEMHVELLGSLRDHDITFEDSRRILSNWVAQPHLVDEGWAAYWEDLCSVEIERWNTR